MENKTNIMLATQNQHKYREINSIFKQNNINIQMLKRAFIAEENGKTLYENALIKAKAALAVNPKKYTLADDTGLFVEALDGRPGIYSARYGGNNQMDKIEKLLNEMDGKNNRKAKFVCEMVLLSPNNEILISSKGEIEGKIVEKISGSFGFGYDPIFYVDKYNQTLASMTQLTKNTVSHRAKALEPIINFIKNNSDYFCE